MSKQIEFTRTLLSYSAIGAAAALTGGSAQAGIIANTSPQSFDVTNGTFAFINFDGSGIDEFEIRGGSISSLSGFVGLYRGSTSVRHLEDSSSLNGGGHEDPNALPAGFLIGPGGDFNDNEVGDTIVATQSGSPEDSGGNFAAFAGQVRYIGARFMLGGNVHFGWVALELNPDLLTGTVTGYAYEACAGEAISAGTSEGGAKCGDSGATPEPSSLALMAAGAAGLFALRRRKTA